MTHTTVTIAAVLALAAVPTSADAHTVSQAERSADSDPVVRQDKVPTVLKDENVYENTASRFFGRDVGKVRIYMFRRSDSSAVAWVKCDNQGDAFCRPTKPTISGIHINAAKWWELTDNQRCHVYVHEYGHLLGYGHTRKANIGLVPDWALIPRFANHVMRPNLQIAEDLVRVCRGWAGQ